MIVASFSVIGAIVFGFSALISGLVSPRKLPFWPMALFGGVLGFALGIAVQVASA